MTLLGMLSSFDCCSYPEACRAEARRSVRPIAGSVSTSASLAAATFMQADNRSICAMTNIGQAAVISSGAAGSTMPATADCCTTDCSCASTEVSAQNSAAPSAGVFRPLKVSGHMNVTVLQLIASVHAAHCQNGLGRSSASVTAGATGICKNHGIARSLC